MTDQTVMLSVDRFTF